MQENLPDSVSLSDRPKIIEKFSQLADENGHVLLPGASVLGLGPVAIIINCLQTTLVSYSQSPSLPLNFKFCLIVTSLTTCIIMLGLLWLG